MRNRDFMNEVGRQKKRLISQGANPSVDDLIRAAVAAPAPNYYLCYDYALRQVGRHVRNERFSRSRRHAMIAELADKCREVRRRHPRLTLGQALARLLNDEPASSFFLSFAQGRKIYYRMRRMEHRRCGRRERKLF